MAWFGKVVGGAIGAILGGPVGAAAGAGVGHLYDADSDSQPAVSIELGALELVPDMAPGGPGLVLKAEAAFRAQIAGAQVIAWLRVGAERVQSRVATYANEGGLLVLRGVFIERPEGIFVVAFLPYAVLPQAPPLPAAVTCEILVIDENGICVGANSWNVRIPLVHERTSAPLSHYLAAAASLAQASGGFSQPELKAVLGQLVEAFELDDAGQLALLELLDATFERSVPFMAAIAPFLDQSAEVKTKAFLYLAAIAAADGEFDERERPFLLQFAGAMDVDVDLLFEVGLAKPEERFEVHYRALELETGATWPEIKAAYRRLAGDYHPDKVAQMPRGFQEFAHGRMLAINDAYEALKQALGK